MGFGRLERVAGAQPMSEINVTPLVDVMLVLVVIFILTAPLLASSIALQLPQASAAKPSSTTSAVTLVVNAKGQTFLNDRAITLAQLAPRLLEVARKNPDTEVQLRADQAVPYGQVVAVMNLAQQAGLNRIGFVAESKAP